MAEEGEPSAGEVPITVENLELLDAADSSLTTATTTTEVNRRVANTKETAEDPEETIVFSPTEPTDYETPVTFGGDDGDNDQTNDGDGKNAGLSILVEPSPSYVSSVSSTTGMGSPFTPSSTSRSNSQSQFFSQSGAPTTPPAPASSQGTVPLHHNKSNNNNNSSSMTTIDNSSPQHSSSSVAILRNDSDEAMNIPPVHPFFHQHGVTAGGHYDSDGSDASFVHKAGISPAGSTSSSRNPPRDRFPSYDSSASTGSIKYVPSHSHHPSHPRAYPPSASHQQHQQQSHLLPYHERRKLMQQREQQQSSNGHRQPSAPHKPPGAFPHLPPHAIMAPPPGMDPRLFAGYPPQHQHPSQSRGPPAPGPSYQLPPMDPMAAAAFFNLYGMPPPGYPHPYGGGYPPPFHPYAYGGPSSSGGAPHHTPSSSAPAPPPGHPYAPPSATRTPTGPIHHQHGGVYAYPYGMPPAAPPGTHSSNQQHQQHQQQAMQPLPSSSQPPATGETSSGIRPRLSPYRSLPKPSVQERPPTGKTLGRGRGPKPPPASSVVPQHRFSSSGTDDSRPPPPPPPPQPSGYHARTDSFGSLSSLGSAHQDDPPDHEAAPSTPSHRRQASGGSGGFLDLLRKQWTPSPGATPAPEATVSDFHRKNQRFLHRVHQHSGGAHSASNSPQQALHRRVNSQDRPPASRGTHRRLNSISNDDWEETDEDQHNESTKDHAAKTSAPQTGTADNGGGDFSFSSGGYSSSSDTDHHKPLLQQQQQQQHAQRHAQRHRDSGPARAAPRRHESRPHRDRRGPDYYFEYDDAAHETTSLLPPSGISTNEQDGAARNPPTTGSSRDHRRRGPDATTTNDPVERWDDHRAAHHESSRSHRKSRKKKHKRRQKLARNYEGEFHSSDSSNSNQDYRQWTKKRARMLEKERAKLIAQWKAEARVEAETSQREARANQWHNQAGRALRIEWRRFSSKFSRCVIGVETFIANLPLTIGAVAMAVVTLGVVWFKFAEENLESCEPVHFHSSQCTFPEFPGCFYCDTHAQLYRLALGFHFGCKISAGILAMFFVLKVLLATRVVVDEMSSPTTASPAGLLCMTTVCVFAGRGLIGQFMVTSAAFVHFGLVVWFIYMALAYHIMPEPSWFPNTVGVGLTAVKTWLYYPTAGHLLMLISLLSNFFFFPISLIRVAINKKISATVGWMQMSAPAVSLYALTIMAQPSFAEEHPDVTQFQRVHRMVYLPCMHVMAALSILGFLASCHSLWNRWRVFRKREFSPAHAAFCFPVLSHANALQAYRGAIISFSDIHPRSWRMVTLYVYWFTILMGGTIATIWITAKFLYHLPKWTNLDLLDEEEPPAPNETIIALQDMVTAGETMRQPFVSPAVLQANETGALVLARSGPEGELRYVRTRRLPALGFEPTMNWSEMQEEREVLLEWTAQNPPRRRHRTLSVPGIDFSYGAGFGTGNSGVYGAVGWSPLPSRRRADSFN